MSGRCVCGRGHGLNYLERCGGMDKLPVCVAGGAGVDLDETVKSCKQHGLRRLGCDSRHGQLAPGFSWLGTLAERTFKQSVG